MTSICNSLLSSGPKTTDAGPEVRALVVAKLGYLPKVRTESRGTTDGRGQSIWFTAEDTAGENIGTLKIYLQARGTARIDDLYVPEAARGKKISELLFAQMVLENPRVQRIASTLMDDNRRLIMAEVDRGTPCAEAIRRSPAGRMRARFGFTRFLTKPKCSFDEDIELVMGR